MDTIEFILSKMSFQTIVTALSIFSFVMFLFLGRIFTSKEQQKIINRTRKFEDYRVWFLIFVFTFVPATTFLLAWSGTLVQRAYLQFATPDVVFALRASGFMFAIPSFFLSLVIFAFFGPQLYSFITRRKIGSHDIDFLRYYFSHYRIWPYRTDPKMGSIALSILIVLVFVGGFYLGCDTYTKITPTEIVDDSYFTLNEKRYSYQDVQKIVYMIVASNGTTQKAQPKRPSYAVVMDDGYVLDTQNFGQNGYAEEERAMKYVSEKSGVPITRGAKGVADRL